jgi:hypothetical protein
MSPGDHHPRSERHRYPGRRSTSTLSPILAVLFDKGANEIVMTGWSDDTRPREQV